MAELKIECPKCGWEPDGGAYWNCSQCGHIWNTFDTAAQCPECGFQHEHTACIPYAGGCHAYEPHIDWYKNLGEIIQEELDTVLVEQEAELTNIALPQNTTTGHSLYADAGKILPESVEKLPPPAA